MGDIESKIKKLKEGYIIINSINKVYNRAILFDKSEGHFKIIYSNTKSNYIVRCDTISKNKVIRLMKKMDYKVIERSSLKSKSS